MVCSSSWWTCALTNAPALLGEKGAGEGGDLLSLAGFAEPARVCWEAWPHKSRALTWSRARAGCLGVLRVALVRGVRLQLRSQLLARLGWRAKGAALRGLTCALPSLALQGTAVCQGYGDLRMAGHAAWAALLF